MDFNLRSRIVERASELRERMDTNLAVAIVNALAHSLDSGRGN